jgi:hypothetical protein
MTDAIIKTTEYVDVAYNVTVGNPAVIKTSSWVDVAITNPGIAPITLRSYSIEVIRSRAVSSSSPVPPGSYTIPKTIKWNVQGYYSTTFKTQWHTAYTAAKGYLDHFVIGARNGTTSSIALPNPISSIDSILKISSPTDAPVITPTIPPNVNVGEIAHSYGDVYRRVWIIPTVLNFINPELGGKAPFLVWSAWNVKNIVISAAITGTPAIALDLTTPYTFQISGSKIINAIISDDAYPEIDTIVVFNFDHGISKSIKIVAQLLLFDRKIPDSTVEEQYNWLTNILTSFNGTEQRISIRGAPRRVINATFRLETDEQISRFQELIYKGNNTSIGVPMWQYASGLRNNVNIGTNIFDVDLAMADIRPGDSFLIVDLSDDLNFEVFTVSTVGLNTFTTLVTSGKNFKAGRAIIVPLMIGKIQDSSHIKIDTVWGETSLTVEDSNGHLLVTRPNTPGNLVTMFDGYPVLDRVPLNTANEMSTINNAELIDYDVGITVKKINWSAPKLSISRQFVLQRLQTVNELDYWKEFMQAVNGSQKPFLMRTFGRDLEVDQTSSSLTNSIVVLGKFYGDSLFSRESHKRLIFHTDQGFYYRKILSVSVDTVTRKTVLNLEIPLPNIISAVKYIEFTLKMRLTNDQISLTHDIDESILSLSGITTEQ